MAPGKARSDGRAAGEDMGLPWKMTAIGITLIVVTAVITVLVVGGWGPRAALEALFSPVVPAPPATAPVAGSPSPTDVEACNQYANAQAGDKAIEVVKEGAAAEAGRGAGKGAVNGGMVSAAAGTLHGINERKRNDARYVEAYRACMKGRGFSS
jgi:hypothetical protein